MVSLGHSRFERPLSGVRVNVARFLMALAIVSSGHIRQKPVAVFEAGAEMWTITLLYAAHDRHLTCGSPCETSH